MRSFLAIILFVLLLFPMHAVAKLPASVNEFVEALERTVTGPQPFMQFDKVVDPKRQFETPVSSIKDLLRKEFRNKAPRFDVLYRNKDSNVAETIIGTIWAGERYFFLAFVLHRRPEGWIVISMSMQSSYEKVLKYR